MPDSGPFEKQGMGAGWRCGHYSAMGDPRRQARRYYMEIQSDPGPVAQTERIYLMDPLYSRD